MQSRLFALGSLLSACSPALGDSTWRVSTGPVQHDGSAVQGNAQIEYAHCPVMSADGRHVLFLSAASNLVAGDTNAQVDAFVHDNHTGRTVRVSLGPGEVEGNTPVLSNCADISADGRFVVFTSAATNFAANGTAGFHVFLRDRDTDGDGIFDEPGAAATTFINLVYNGQPCTSTSASALCAISGDGNVIVAEMRASGVPFKTIVHYNRASATTSLVNTKPDGGFGHGEGPSLSHDGRVVAFVGFFIGYAGKVFVKNMQSGELRAAGLGVGTMDSLISKYTSISGDGSYALFSLGGVQFPGDDFETDVFLYDWQANTWELAGRAHDGTPATGQTAAYRHAISRNGRYLSYSSLGPLTPGNRPGADCFIRDRWTGAVWLASASSQGGEGNGDSWPVSITPDAAMIAFNSGASNFAPGDTNGQWDVFVRMMDRDDDGLPNVWETDGIDVNGDGVKDYPLDALNADPDHKDLFVEVDAMNGLGPVAVAAVPEVVAAGLATGTALDHVIRAFLEAPVANPDGQTGIRLHIQVDDTTLPVATNAVAAWQLADTDADGVPDWPTGFDALKQASFGLAAEHANATVLAAKALAFRYCIFAHSYEASGSSGLAEMPGNDFMVTLGQWGPITYLHQAGTFMHEFGHTLGLDHGGADDIPYKPNYYSVMNYTWQIPAAEVAGGPSAMQLAYRQSWRLDYSRRAWPQLNEAALDERVGVSGGDAGVVCPAGPVPAQLIRADGTQVDWNRNGHVGSALVPMDITHVRTGSNPSPRELLPGHNDWTALRCRIGGMPGFGDGAHPPHDPNDVEFTYDDYLELSDLDGDDPRVVGDLNCDGVVTVSDIGGFVLALTNPAQYAIDFPSCNINNADVNDDSAISVSDIGPFVALLTGG